MSNFDYIYRLQIHGGEPLLHSEIEKIMTYVLQYKEKIGITAIVTNGTILPSRKLLDVISKNKIVIIASPYRFNANMLKKLKTTCFDNHILYRQFPERKWFKFDPPNKEEYSVYELKSKYWNCPINKFPAYKNGRLYLCARLANILDYKDNLEVLSVEKKLIHPQVSGMIPQLKLTVCKLCANKENQAVITFIITA